MPFVEKSVQEPLNSAVKNSVVIENARNEESINAGAGGSSSVSVAVVIEETNKKNDSDDTLV